MNFEKIINQTINNLNLARLRSYATKYDSKKTIHIHSRVMKNGKRYFGIRENRNGIKKETYISADNPLISEVANSQFSKTALSQITTIGKYAEKLTDSIQKLNTIQRSYYHKYGPALNKAFYPNEIRAQEWAKESYETNTHHYENEIFYESKKGDLVRSRAELFIADMLFSMKISYRYECKLDLNDGIIFPNFTIMHPENGEIFFLEYFGMMSNPTYAQACIRKINRYANNGICLGDKLLAAFESAEQPLNTVALRKMIEITFC